MKKETVILLVVNDKDINGMFIHGMKEAGINNKIESFSTSAVLFEYLDSKNNSQTTGSSAEYILFIDDSIQDAAEIDVLKSIKSAEKLRMTPVIILSDDPSPSLVEKCYNAGCSAYINKPDNSKKFEEMINKIGRFIGYVEFAHSD